MKEKFFGAVFFAALGFVFATSTLRVTAAPPVQNPLPTDEPTKRPYVFSTPIFIPTFVSATDLPPRSATPAPRQPTVIPATPAPSTPIAPAQPKPSATIADISATPTEEAEVIEPQPEEDSLASAAANALIAMSVVLFLGFLGIAISAYVVYKRTQRAERIALIKNRLKGK